MVKLVGWGLCTHFSLWTSLAHGFFLLMLCFNVEEEVFVIRNGWTPRKREEKIVVVSSPHQSPRCGVSRFLSAQSTTIPLSVWSASISPAHWSRKSTWRVEKVRKFWLPTGDPAAKRQLPFGPGLSSVEKVNQYSVVLRTVLDKNTSSSLRKVKDHNNSTWFE